MPSRRRGFQLRKWCNKLEFKRISLPSMRGSNSDLMILEIINSGRFDGIRLISKMYFYLLLQTQSTNLNMYQHNTASMQAELHWLHNDNKLSPDLFALRARPHTRYTRGLLLMTYERRGIHSP